MDATRQGAPLASPARSAAARYLIPTLDSLRGSSVRIGTMQRRLAWPPAQG